MVLTRAGLAGFAELDFLVCLAQADVTKGKIAALAPAAPRKPLRPMDGVFALLMDQALNMMCPGFAHLSLVKFEYMAEYPSKKGAAFQVRR